MFLSPTSPDHLLWCLHAIGLSFVGQPSSSLGPVPHHSERGGQSSPAWYHLPTCTPHSTLASSAHLLPESLRVWTGSQVWGRGQSFSAHSMPWDILPPARGLGLASVEASRLRSRMVASRSFGPATSLHIRARTQGGAVPPGEEPPRSLGSGAQHPFPPPWGHSCLLVFKKRG